MPPACYGRAAMTSRQLRNQRRAAARKSRKLERSGRACPASAEPTPQAVAPETIGDEIIGAEPTRAEINRANSLHSRGPRSPEGKAKSSQNSFKHGLYSKQLVLPNEDPAELDDLRASLRAQHQPANTTEEILVNELAENFWRIRRMRQLEARTLNPENLENLATLLPAIHRAMASAERAFHKSLAALRSLQQDRGFVPQIGFVSQNSANPQTGFVSQNTTHPDPAPPLTRSPERSDGSLSPSDRGFVSHEAAKRAGATGFVSQAAAETEIESKFVQKNQLAADPAIGFVSQSEPREAFETSDTLLIAA